MFFFVLYRDAHGGNVSIGKVACQDMVAPKCRCTDACLDVGREGVVQSVGCLKSQAADEHGTRKWFSDAKQNVCKVGACTRLGRGVSKRMDGAQRSAEQIVRGHLDKLQEATLSSSSSSSSSLSSPQQPCCYVASSSEHLYRGEYTLLSSPQ